MCPQVLALWKKAHSATGISYQTIHAQESATEMKRYGPEWARQWAVPKKSQSQDTCHCNRKAPSSTSMIKNIICVLERKVQIHPNDMKLHCWEWARLRLFSQNHQVKMDCSSKEPLTPPSHPGHCLAIFPKLHTHILHQLSLSLLKM